MNPSRHLLLIEDISITYYGLKMEFESAEWRITRAVDEESTLYAWEQAQKRGDPIDAVALDLGLPPAKDNPMAVGLPLARKLREIDEAMPILAYTSLSTKACDYGQLVARLLPLRISFISLRGDRDVNPSALLDLVWRGFVVFSPMIADYLPRAVAVKPDPLNSNQWETLQLLSEGRTQDEAARDLPVGADAVKARLRRVGEILAQAGELEPTHAEQTDLVRWYRENHVRYCRP